MQKNDTSQLPDGGYFRVEKEREDSHFRLICNFFFFLQNKLEENITKCQQF